MWECNNINNNNNNNNNNDGDDKLLLLLSLLFVAVVMQYFCWHAVSQMFVFPSLMLNRQPLKQFNGNGSG
jgi:hypothetical protein